MIHTEYYMSKSVSHAVSTREPYISRGLIQHVIQILTCNVHYIIYFNHAFDNTCIFWKFWKFWNFLNFKKILKFCNFEIFWVYDIGYKHIGYKRYRLGTIIDNAYTKHLYFNLNYTLYKNVGFWLVNSRDIFYKFRPCTVNLQNFYFM